MSRAQDILSMSEASSVVQMFSDDMVKMVQEVLGQMGVKEKVGKVGGSKDLGKPKMSYSRGEVVITYPEMIIFDKKENIIGHYDINVMVGIDGKKLDMRMSLVER